MLMKAAAVMQCQPPPSESTSWLNWYVSTGARLPRKISATSSRSTPTGTEDAQRGDGGSAMASTILQTLEVPHRAAGSAGRAAARR